MNISDLRTYFINRIQAEDSDFREHTDGFNRDNIPSTLLNKTFHIEFGNFSGEGLVDQVTKDVQEVNVFLYFKGFRDPKATIDTGMDTGNNIRLGAIKFENIAASLIPEMKKVILNSMSPSPIDTNDNSIIITLSFSVDMSFCP